LMGRVCVGGCPVVTARVLGTPGSVVVFCSALAVREDEGSPVLTFITLQCKVEFAKVDKGTAGRRAPRYA
jgi:hypothetical protein